MEYEWDETKRQANIHKHGLDFVAADRVFEAPEKITIKTTPGSEVRWVDLAEVKGNVLMLVYTYRGKVVRCISYRKASRKERRLYEQARKNR